MANILEMIQSNDMLKVALILFGVYLFVTFMQKPITKAEQLENMGEEEIPLAEPVEEQEQEQEQGQAPSSSLEQATEQAHIDKIVAGEDKIKPEDLLPKYDEANEFAKENPVSKLLKEQNFLISGYHVGINTVMQSNKIPYHDIRSLPPIPKENIGPWNQSSFEQSPAQMRRFFEIGV